MERRHRQIPAQQKKTLLLRHCSGLPTGGTIAVPVSGMRTGIILIQPEFAGQHHGIRRRHGCCPTSRLTIQIRNRPGDKINIRRSENPPQCIMPGAGGSVCNRGKFKEITVKHHAETRPARFRPDHTGQRQNGFRHFFLQKTVEINQRTIR